MGDEARISGELESSLMGFNEPPSGLVGPGVIVVRDDGIELQGARRRGTWFFGVLGVLVGFVLIGVIFAAQAALLGRAVLGGPVVVFGSVIVATLGMLWLGSLLPPKLVTGHAPWTSIARATMKGGTLELLLVRTQPVRGVVCLRIHEGGEHAMTVVERVRAQWAPKSPG